MEILKISNLIRPEDVVVTIDELEVGGYSFTARKNGALIAMRTDEQVSFEAFLSGVRPHVSENGRVLVNDLSVKIDEVCSLRKQ